MRHILFMAIVGTAIALSPGAARAQNMPTAAGTPYRMNAVFGAPGLYGMLYGTPSYGVPRTYTAFNSPYGLGYGYGYAPYGILPGRYGVGLWRPGFVTPGYAYGASYYYGTFPVPYSRNYSGPLPAVGDYAPAFGPPSYMGW